MAKKKETSTAPSAKPAPVDYQALFEAASAELDVVAAQLRAARDKLGEVEALAEQQGRTQYLELLSE